MTSLINKIPLEVTEAVGESLKLLQGSPFIEQPRNPEHTLPLPSLMERCNDLIARDDKPSKEPVRLIHHFACTGGTLIAKCVASMPNTQLLSEVEPHSTIPQQRRSKFSPTDLIGLVRNSSRGSESELESKLFVVALETLYEDCTRKGLRLILRDHAHSSYCTGPAISAAPHLRRLLKDRHPLQSVVTVRHPLDSWLSLNNNGWVHFQPGSLDEYAARYHHFLDDHAELPTFRYEDFVGNPDQQLQDMCAALDLPYTDDYKMLFAVHQFSGDSGRSSDVIGSRPRRDVPDEIAEEASASTSYRGLCGRLGYDTSKYSHLYR